MDGTRLHTEYSDENKLYAAYYDRNNPTIGSSENEHDDHSYSDGKPNAKYESEGFFSHNTNNDQVCRYGGHSQGGVVIKIYIECRIFTRK